MKERKVRENDKFKGIIDGKHYVVVHCPAQGQSVDLQNDCGGVFTIPKAALEKAFIFEGNDTPFPETKKGEYLIKDGQLFRDGERIETGTLRPIEIVDCVKTGVYMTVEPKEKGEGKELRFYAPETDRFSVVAQGADTYTVIYNDRKVIGVVARSTRPEKLMPEKEGEEPEAVMAVSERILFIEGPEIAFATVPPSRGFLLSYDPSPVEETAEKAVDSTGREEAYARHLFFVLDRKAGAKTNVDGELLFVEEKPGEVLDRTIDESLVMKVSIFYDGYNLVGPETVFPEYSDARIETQLFTVEGEVRRITPCFNGMLDALVVTDQGITFSNFAYCRPRQAKGQDVLDLVKKYPMCLSLNVNKAGTISVFTLCDSAYNMASVKVEKTRDRGFINTIAENPGFGFQPAGDLE